MKHWLEAFIVRLWNRSQPSRQSTPPAERALDLGALVADGEVTLKRISIPHDKRMEHLSITGKTGSGKSHELKSLAKQDIRDRRGFVAFDFHGDTIPFLLGTIADQEKLTKRDLSKQTIVVSPADPEASVGINVLEARAGMNRFVQVDEFTQILQRRWRLDLGARTAELLRNTLYALSESGLTLAELDLFLNLAPFRAACLKKVRNAEVRRYFEERYDSVSDAMRAVMREPILNKASAFTADPSFRGIIAQSISTFSLVDAIDRGCWILFDLPKGKLGEQVSTLASLFFSMIVHAVFARKQRNLFTIYADEAPNLISFGSGFEMLLSESRKFGISIVCAGQFQDQYSPEMRAALAAIGTHLYFQLSASDANEVAGALDGGKSLAQILKNLPQRHFVVKTGSERWQEARVSTLANPKIDPSDLYARCRARWARGRTDIEAEISARQSLAQSGVAKDTLDDWE